MDGEYGALHGMNPKAVWLQMSTIGEDGNITTAGELRAVLFEWRTQGYLTVVIVLTGTQFCDSTRPRELVWAHKRGGGRRRLAGPVVSVGGWLGRWGDRFGVHG